MTLRPDEFSLIAKYFAPLAGEGAFDLKDDAAEIVPTEGCSLVITQDAVAEGIHFFSDDEPALIAKKALRVNLSDLAAKGAVPKHFSLALGLCNAWDEEWIADFAAGLGEDCEKYQIGLTGGDTFRTGGGFVISITAIGEVPRNRYVSRLSGSAGDSLFVTGTIGDGALGLLARQGKLSEISDENIASLEERYLLPQPRCEFTEIIAKHASASMDVSDGLIGDLEKLCSASCLAAEIDMQSIPFSKAVSDCIELESDFAQIAVTGGDDYEILFAVPQSELAAFEKACSLVNVPVTRIGALKRGEGVTVFDKPGVVVEFDQTGYNHSGENS